MRIGILSDVHANIAALEATLRELERRRVDEVICLGDCIGYGPEPARCLDLLFDACSIILAGNHDFAAAGKLADSAFNPLARYAVQFARENLRPDQIQRLRELPLEVEREGLLLVHASPVTPEDFPYLHHPEDALQAFRRREFSTAVCGHTHIPLSFRLEPGGNRVTVSLNPAIQLSPSTRVICNVGSVGQPRDRDPRAAFAIFDVAEQSIRLHRVEYDIQETSAKIAAAGLPEALGRRLFAGV